tara:strand:- start:1355 stop:2536 length:1182 start_codon:yes stop_codon:yes gene_type:complete
MGLKPIGSETLKGQDKISRIMEIANYGTVNKNTENHTKTTSFLKEGKDGNFYAIIQEKDGYHIKSGLNESDLDYIDGIRNKNKNRFKSYSAALKRLNLIFKPINEQYNEGVGDNMYGEIEDQEERFTLKTPDAPSDDEDMDMDDDMDMDMDDDMGMDDDMDMGDEEMGMDDDMDMGGEEGEEQEMEGAMKSIQKLTGKLGQKLRDGEEELESEDIKYVINSVLSALELDKLEDEDKEDIVSRFEEDETEYGDEELEGGDVDLEDDEFGTEDEMGMDDEGDMDMEMDGEEMDMEEEETEEGEGEVMESLKKRVSKLLDSYIEKKTPKNYLEEIKKTTIKNKVIEKHSSTVDQELSAKKFIKENNATPKGLTKSGAIIMISEGKKVYIDKNGSIR